MLDFPESCAPLRRLAESLRGFVPGAEPERREHALCRGGTRVGESARQDAPARTRWCGGACRRGARAVGSWLAIWWTGARRGTSKRAGAMAPLCATATRAGAGQRSAATFCWAELEARLGRAACGARRSLVPEGTSAAPDRGIAPGIINCRIAFGRPPRLCAQVRAPDLLVCYTLALMGQSL